MKIAKESKAKVLKHSKFIELFLDMKPNIPGLAASAPSSPDVDMQSAEQTNGANAEPAQDKQDGEALIAKEEEKKDEAAPKQAKAPQERKPGS